MSSEQTFVSRHRGSQIEWHLQQAGDHARALVDGEPVDELQTTLAQQLLLAHIESAANLLYEIWHSGNGQQVAGDH